MKALYKSYPSNLTSDQWAIIEPYLPDRNQEVAPVEWTCLLC